MDVEGLGIDGPAPGGPAPRARRRALERESGQDVSPLYRVTKRIMDIAFAGGLIIVTSPLLCVASLLVVLGDRGPVLYWQRRAGKDGVEFWLPKLRSMHVGAEKVPIERPARDTRPGVPPKFRDDPRVTRVGRWLRRWSVDELPQLWCVLRGEMSMVGPRPSLSAEAACYGELERKRLAAKPGITCIWQVSGRSDLPFADQVALDLEYIESRNLWLDTRIILKTVRAVLSRRGAY